MSINTLQLKIATPEGMVYEGSAKSVNLRTTEGEMGVFPHHIPLVGKLVPCTAVIREEAGEKRVELSEGFVEVRKNSEVIVLADEASIVS